MIAIVGRRFVIVTAGATTAVIAEFAVPVPLAFLAVTATRPLADGELTASLYGGTRDLDNPLTFAVVAIDRVTVGGTARLTSAASPFGDRHRVSAGVDIQRLDDDRKNFENCNGVGVPTAACPRATRWTRNWRRASGATSGRASADCR